MREQIISFATNIIYNGVNSGLTNTKIEEGIKTYIKYLKTQDFADEETLNILNTVLITLPELIKLVKVHKSSFITGLILNMYTEKYNKQIMAKQIGHDNPIKHTKMKNHIESIATDRCGNSFVSTNDRCGTSIIPVRVDRCETPNKRDTNSCGRITVTTDSCGGGRSRTRSSC